MRGGAAIKTLEKSTYGNTMYQFNYGYLWIGTACETKSEQNIFFTNVDDINYS